MTLDAGALIAFEHGNRRVWVLVQRAKDRGAEMTIPAGVLAQVGRSGARQTPDRRTHDVLQTGGTGSALSFL